MKRGVTFKDPQKYGSSSSHMDDSDFHDDEPLSVPSTLAIGHEKVAVKTFTEFPAIAASDSISEFAVLLDVRGPPLSFGDGQNRVPIDLVFVLDVSGSMWGKKLSILKSATRFVINRMLPCDRLSIVAFSSSASRILPLRRMTEEGRQAAKQAVDQLRVDDSTNIVAGLNMGAKILEERRDCNPVSSIIFVSDGEDTDNGGCENSKASRSDPPAYLKLLSSSIFCGNRDTFRKKEHSVRQRFPVHAFGVGSDHDSVAMNAISDASGGTFSYLKTAEIIPTSFARCIGGLFSVMAQDVRLTVWSASPGVEIKEIPSGRHESAINSEKKQGTIHIGDLYAEEKKDFLVHVSVPLYSEAKIEEDGMVRKTPLLDIVCYYLNPLSNETEQVEVESVEILRPTALFSADATVNLEVDSQKNRVRVAETIEKAKEMADKGNLKEAQEVLTNSRETLMASASAKSGDVVVNQLEAELRAINARMATMGLYEKSGRPLVLAGLSAHNWQRATTTVMQQSTTLFDGSGSVDEDDDDDDDDDLSAHNWHRATTASMRQWQRSGSDDNDDDDLSARNWHRATTASMHQRSRSDDDDDDDSEEMEDDGDCYAAGEYDMEDCAGYASGGYFREDYSVCDADVGSEIEGCSLMEEKEMQPRSKRKSALQCAAAPTIYDTPLMQMLVSDAQEKKHD